MANIEPGTYRITNVASGTAIAIPENNIWDVVCWERNNNRNQQWFVQRSGGGYRFKNCQYGGHYLAISETKLNAPVYAAWYPITWRLIQNPEDHNMYIIKCGDVDRIMDLDSHGAGNNGNHVHVWPQGRWGAHKRWRFERLSDDTGDEEWQLKKEVAEKNEQLTSKDQQLASKVEEVASKDQHLAQKDQLITELTERLMHKDQELTDKNQALAHRDQELARLQQELSEKSTLLEQTQNSLREAEASLKSPGLELNIKGGGLEDELSQQKKETASLREKMERFERLFSQMMDPEVKRPNNMT